MYLKDKKIVAKEKIFYSRSYRYLAGNKKQSILYLLCLVLPCLVLLFLFYGEICEFVADSAAEVLRNLLPNANISLAEVDFIPNLDTIKIVVLPTNLPTGKFAMVNIGITLVALFFCVRGKRKNKPISIFLAIMMFVHIINCAYFVFAAKEFPYSIRDYSGLYMEQQVGIWIAFLVIIGLVTGILGYKAIPLRIVTFISVMVYSFIFGWFRYIVSLYIVYKFSVLYIALFFFALGPFFDFLYLVCIYGFYVDRMIKTYSGEKGMEEWRWS